jgi:hypothetical protein
MIVDEENRRKTDLFTKCKAIEKQKEHCDAHLRRHQMPLGVGSQMMNASPNLLTHTKSASILLVNSNW